MHCHRIASLVGIGQRLSVRLVRHEVLHWVADEGHTGFNLRSHGLEGRVDLLGLQHYLVYLGENVVLHGWLVVIPEPHEVRHRLGCE
jgi:hypothetical protein